MDLIDIEPMYPGWGRIWQGSDFADIDDIPKPRVVVSLIGSIQTEMSLSVFIRDVPEGCLPDTQLIGMTDAVIAFLKNGSNVYIHCLQGKSRSSYLDIAVHMRAINLFYDDAFALVKKQHPIAQPNSGFEAQLRRLETVLRSK